MVEPMKACEPNERPWQPWERNFSGGRIGVQEQQGTDEKWMILHVESGGASTTTSLRHHEAWDLALMLSPPLKARLAELFQQARKAEAALHNFTYAESLAPLLRKLADDWDCDSAQCEHASSDCGSLSCPKMDGDGCRAVEADELRQFADALETKVISTPAHPTGEVGDIVERLRDEGGRIDWRETMQRAADLIQSLQYVAARDAEELRLTRQKVCRQKDELERLQSRLSISDENVERVAAAVYDAPDSQSGDTIGTVIWNSEHLFYETIEGEEIVDTARRASMPVCRDMVRAVIASLGGVG